MEPFNGFERINDMYTTLIYTRGVLLIDREAGRVIGGVSWHSEYMLSSPWQG